uniref:Uncharacterized protein n=1 Tax=Brassica oleracea var. oleracea TaxID=109376 RepID=A0A0D3EAV2_BRAOL
MVRVPYVAVTHWTEQVLSLSPSTETHEFSHLSFSSNGRSSKMGGALKDIASNSELDNLRQSGAPVLITLYRDANPNFPTPRRGGTSGNKFRMSLGLPIAATVNCADNTVKKAKPDLRKKVLPAVIVRQRKPWRRKDGVFIDTTRTFIQRKKKT